MGWAGAQDCAHANWQRTVGLAHPEVVAEFSLCSGRVALGPPTLLTSKGPPRSLLPTLFLFAGKEVSPETLQGRVQGGSYPRARDWLQGTGSGWAEVQDPRSACRRSRLTLGMHLVLCASKGQSRMAASAPPFPVSIFTSIPKFLDGGGEIQVPMTERALVR